MGPNKIYKKDLTCESLRIKLKIFYKKKQLVNKIDTFQLSAKNIFISTSLTKEYLLNCVGLQKKLTLVWLKIWLGS